MTHLDTFLDTKEKRGCAFALVVIMAVMTLSIAYLRQSRMLIAIRDYDDVFYLLRSSLIDQTYLSRFIVTLIQYDSVNTRTLIQIIFSALRMGEVIIFLAWILLGMSQAYRRVFQWLLGLFVIWILAVAVMIYSALHAQTLMQAVTLLHQIGYVTSGVVSMELIIQCFAFLRFAFAYRKALKYQVVEIYEPNDPSQEKTYGQ